MANLLTAIRLFLVIPVGWSFADPEFISPALLLGLIVLAIVSDYLDGKVARALNTASARGMLFDHGTDFLFVTAGLAGAAATGAVSALLPVLIVFAFSQYVFDSYVLSRQKKLRMSLLGRWNGIFYFVPLLVLAVSRFTFLADMQATLETGVTLLGYVLIVSTAASIVDRGLARTSH